MQTLSLRCIFLSLALMLAACGGGSSGNDNSLVFRGTVLRETASEDVEFAEVEPVVGAEVCALGRCGFTEADGTFLFGVDGESFAGGDVLFTFSGGGSVVLSTIVFGVSADADDVELEFLQTGEDEIVLVSMSQSDDDLEDIGEEVEEELESAGDSLEEEVEEI